MKEPPSRCTKRELKSCRPAKPEESQRRLFVGLDIKAAHERLGTGVDFAGVKPVLQAKFDAERSR